MKMDRTDLFNLLAAIAGVILAGGDMLPLEISDGVPAWGVPILLFVALTVNYFSRSQVKDEGGRVRDELAIATRREDPDGQ